MNLLISGLPNTGKTSLLQTLDDVLIIANDGKNYPFEQPHINVGEITTADQWVDNINTSIGKYEERFGKLPKYLVIDSISKTLLDIEAHYLRTVNSFPYGPIGRDISACMHYIQTEIIPAGINIIFVSHAFKDDQDLSLVNAGGSWGKKGGVLSEVDEAIYIDTVGKKRRVTFKNHKLARSLVYDGDDTINVEDFNLKEYTELLLENGNKASKWILA